MRSLISFRGSHAGAKIVVCGCGVSLKELDRPERFITIGVNDVGRLFQPNYLLVVDPARRFKGDRFRYVEESRAEYLFTQLSDLGVAHPNIVKFRLGEKNGVDFADPEALHYSVVTPYMALYLAAYMGASSIGMIGVDFTDHHFFGETGRHAWSPHVAQIDEQFRRLGESLAGRGQSVFNLSAVSRLTAFPKMELETFAELTGRPAGLSVVVASLNEGEHLRRTIDNLTATLPRDGEIVVVDDGSTDGSTDFLGKGDGTVRVVRGGERLGSAGARNFGAKHALGKTLVFSDAHIAAPRGWVDGLLEPLERPDVGAAMPAIRAMRGSGDEPGLAGCGLRWRDASLAVEWLHGKSLEPYPVPLLGVAFLAIRRNLFAAVGGFDSGLTVWGAEDAELSLRLWTLGYECLVVPGVEVAHLFRRERPYRVGWEPVVHNKLRLAALHFGPRRLERVIHRLKESPGFAAALVRLLGGDAQARHAELDKLRRHDDDWFFHRFREELPNFD